MTILYEATYADYDGLSIAFDADALRERYGTRAEAFHTDPHDDLLPLRAAGEALAFGTRAGGTFAVSVVLGATYALEIGVLRSSGRLGLAGWHALTMACAHRGGVLEDGMAIETHIPAGTYRVTVERRPSENDPEVFVAITLGLEPSHAAPVEAADGQIPGADGMF